MKKLKNVGDGLVFARRERGITLVALIITIIVMLILVGVSIQVLINSDLIGTAQDAANRTETAYEEEGSTGEITVGDKTYGSIEDYMEIQEKGSISKVIPKEEAKNQKLNNENVQSVLRTETATETYEAPIPVGFTISGREDEQNIKEGLVIYDLKGADSSATNFWTETVTIGGQTYPKVQTLYNQFVWIPVEEAYITAKEITDMINSTETEYASVTSNQKAINYLASKGRYPMAVQLDNGEDYRGILYNFAAGTNEVTITSYADFSILEEDDYTLEAYNREPAYLTNDDYADGSSYNAIGLTQEKLQEEYNAMVKSVKDNGGFYVARYELSYNTTDSIGESKRGKTVARAADANTNMWYGLYSTCQGMYNQTTDKVQSAMISGAQWDQIMIWMKDVKNTNDASKYYVVDSSYMGNYSTYTGGTGAPQVSGYLDNYSVKKVFDLGGNLYDMTTLAWGLDSRIYRGDGCDADGFDSPASGRTNEIPALPAGLASARSTLYVK